MRTASHLLQLLFVVSSVASAHARDSADPFAPSKDSLTIKVYCRDGSFFRGEPVEVVPSDHVTIQLVDGRMKRIDWSKISRVDGLPSRAAKTPSKSDDDEDAELERTPTLNARPPKAPQTASASPSLYGREQVGSMPIGPGVQPVMMRVDGTRPGTAALEYRPVALADGLQDYAEVGWRTGCILPCQFLADPQARFRVTGHSVTASDGFYLPTKGVRANVVVEPGSVSTRIAAIVMFSFSGVFAISSLGVFGAMPDTLSDGNSKPYLGASLGLAGAGLLSIFVAGPLMGASTTTVKVTAAE